MHGTFTTHLNAKSVDEISVMLSADVRLQENSSVDAQGLQGKDAVSNKLISVCAKMGGLLTNSTNQGELMADQITTKTILNLKKGIIKLTVGCSIVWFGGLIRLLVLEKGAGESFMIDTTPPPKQEEGETEDININISSLSLSEPFLIPRPPSFPPPTITLKLLSCSNLVNAPHNLRPLNPYLKVKLPSGSRHVTKVVKLNKNPAFTEADANGCILGLCLNHDDKKKVDSYFDLQIMDWKPVKHRLLGEIRVNIGSFKVGGDEEEVEYEVKMRWRKDATGKIKLKAKVEDMEMWWRGEELKARDERKRRESEEEGGEEGGSEAESNCILS
ncbi:hypothetical protein TL16_g00914 [Triparma laevis f. inornata]|uniref:C2 domain-containing protein n=1 Tax=Triparma laevis f. inornata TaxID=1714386 RepID=A0A9W7DUA6_9STRA|nr:hypothetical protein TL16_g00914 [Triparma laevis f. inornata]